MKKRTLTPTKASDYERFPHPIPCKIFKTTIHGQEVTVKVYPDACKTLGKLKVDYHG